MVSKDEFAENFALVGAFLASMFPGGSPAVAEAKHARYARGQTNLVGLILGVTVSVIVGIGVGVPITNQVIADANLTGTTALIAGFIPVMITLMVFVATASPIMSRT